MKTMPVGELKAHFSEVLDEVRRGSPVAVGFGRSRKPVAVIVSYQDYQQHKAIKLGELEGRAKCLVEPDFAISDEQLLAL